MLQQLTDALGVESKDVIDWGGKIGLAIIALILGFWLVGKISNLVRRALKARGVGEELQSFLGGLINILMKAAVFISVASMVGIETTSFVAMLGAAGLAIGLALQGSLSNFAGGVMLLLFKPFKIGDLIEAQGLFGHVRSINVFVTTLESPDSKTVVIPNGPLANGTITNHSTIGYIRVDLVIGVGYGTNLQHAREVIMAVMTAHDKVLQDPAPSVNVEELGDNSVNLAVRPYCNIEDYWTVYFGITEGVKNALDAAEIDIPYPQRVIHQA